MDHKVQETTNASSRHYDYIIAGAGAAGLSLLVRILRSGKLSSKKILLLDQEVKNKNDRTWCFWEKGTGFFEEIVYRKWQTLWFHGKDFSRKLDIAPYQYKMIRGIDFYSYCLNIIGKAENVTIRYGKVTQLYGNGLETWVLVDNERFTAEYIFNSIILDRPIPKPGEYHLLQHFKGWIINTEIPVFDIKEATLMDFRVDQQQGASFVYVMPFSTTRALVEYTVFSEKVLSQHEYEERLIQYINTFNCGAYEREDEEFGVIPMTNQAFPRRTGNIIYMGTAGGQTKASSGYTFQFIQKSTAAIVDAFPDNAFTPGPDKKFDFYDSVLLNVLATGKVSGDQIFTLLFKKNLPQSIFSFLDNESSFFEDLKIISSLPTLPFLQAGLQQISMHRHR
ncbi:MAG: lycopene cyclase family protein [Chitinophagaceae bacterium]